MIYPLLRYRLLLPVLFLILSVPILAQENQKKSEAIRQKILDDPKVAVVRISDERQTPSMIVFHRQLAYNKTRASSLLADYLEIRSGIDKLDISRQSLTTNNTEIINFQQYFKGLRVEHGGYKALVKNGDIQLFNGAWY